MTTFDLSFRMSLEGAEAVEVLGSDSMVLFLREGIAEEGSAGRT